MSDVLTACCFFGLHVKDMICQRQFGRGFFFLTQTAFSCRTQLVVHSVDKCQTLDGTFDISVCFAVSFMDVIAFCFQVKHVKAVQVALSCAHLTYIS